MGGIAVVIVSFRGWGTPDLYTTSVFGSISGSGAATLPDSSGVSVDAIPRSPFVNAFMSNVDAPAPVEKSVKDIPLPSVDPVLSMKDRDAYESGLNEPELGSREEGGNGSCWSAANILDVVGVWLIAAEGFPVWKLSWPGMGERLKNCC